MDLFGERTKLSYCCRNATLWAIEGRAKKLCIRNEDINNEINRKPLLFTTEYRQKVVSSCLASAGLENSEENIAFAQQVKTYR